MRKSFLRAVAAITAGMLLAIVVPSAGPAQAHVSVSPGQAAQGGIAVLTFRVPNEREKAKTTKVELYLPTDTPIIGATVRQTAGWTSQATRGPLPAPVVVDGTSITQAVTAITWTVRDPEDGIAGTDYQEFGVSLGPLPKTDKIVFKAVQTYADGETVRWIDEPVDGQPEPDEPAVVLRLSAGGERLDEHGMPVADGAAPAAATSAQIAREAAPSNVALAVAIGALVVAVAALAAALIGRRPRRESPES